MKLKEYLEKRNITYDSITMGLTVNFFIENNKQDTIEDIIEDIDWVISVLKTLKENLQKGE